MFDMDKRTILIRSILVVAALAVALVALSLALYKAVTGEQPLPEGKAFADAKPEAPSGPAEEGHPEPSSGVPEPAVTGPPEPEAPPAMEAIYEVRAPEEVFPPAWVDTATPVSIVERGGTLASRHDEPANSTVSIEDLRLEIYMDSNLDYRLDATWHTTPAAEVSNLFVYAYTTHRLTGETTLATVGTLWTTEPEREVEPQGTIALDEDREYVIAIQSCFPSAGCLDYNLSFTTPPIAAANVDCNRIVDNGPHGSKLDLIFVPFNYSREELAAGRLEADVNRLLFQADAGSAAVAARRSFFGVPVLNSSFGKFNAVVVHDEVPCCHNNQLFSIGRRCGFDKGEDIFVIMQNTEGGMAYAQGLGSGNWVMMARGHDWQGVGTTLAHEVGHLIGMDEEYYLASGGVAFPREAPNCDYGNLTCSKWCSGTRSELVGAIHEAKMEYDECMQVFTAGDDAAWHAICTQLDLDEAFERLAGSTFYGAADKDELCMKPRSELQGYVCYAGTLVPLEDENLGVGCREGYGCYFGCGTQYYYTKSSYVSIMGGGALGENNRIYHELDSVSVVPLLPDFSPSANEALEGYFAGFD